MTASEPGNHPDRMPGSLAHRALDLFVYAPAGVVLSAIEDLPGMAAKGRVRLDQEVRNARVVGRFAVDFGLRQVKEQIQRLAGERGMVGAPKATDAPAAGHSPAATPPRRAVRPAGGPAAPPRRVARPTEDPSTHRLSTVPPGTGAQRGATRDAAVDRAIPEYDTLSASQVVRRLDGLSRAELRAVVQHEIANRARRTILHRAEQLLGGSGVVGPPGAESRPPGG